MPSKPQIEFVESHQAYGSDGGPRAAVYYVFRVGQRNVAVEVHNSSEMTRNGQLAPDKVKTAAQAFLEQELARGTQQLPETLVLDEVQMDNLFSRLGWPPRFS
ncbi:MAG TPA: hypothetical protein VGI46_06790 [Candidatus Acidoferrum sp.]|jgi:hypothetical protein